jgi:broad specificity phosphatase PhoE
MSRLLLVRHGQARSFEQDSDRLSEPGEQQARRLGQWLKDCGVRIGEVWSGSLVRQSRTAHIAGQAFAANWPEVRTDARWNEYDAPGVLAKAAPLLAAQDPAFSLLLEAAKAHRHTPEANRHFQRMFEVLMNRWAAGEIEAPGVESWQAFQTRVREALREIAAGPGEGRSVLIVSSGGPIATAVQTVLEAPPRMALDLNWRMRNTSITEFLFTRGRVTLDLFNATPHLDPSLISYR